MTSPRLLEITGLAILAALSGAALVNVTSAYHTGWREFGGAAAVLAFVAEAIWMVSATTIVVSRWRSTSRILRGLYGLGIAEIACGVGGVVPLWRASS